MTIAINGSGTITGVSVGGLPDGIVDEDMLAAGAATQAKRTYAADEIIQVKSTTKTDTASASCGGGNETAQWMSLSITPSATSSKILVLINATIGIDAASNVALRLWINGSTPSAGTGNGDSASSRRYVGSSGYVPDADGRATIPYSYLHSPSSTSAQTYGFVTLHWNGSDTRTMYINRSHSDADQTYVHRAVSTITLMEVAG